MGRNTILYGPYECILNGGSPRIISTDINIDNLNNHLDWVLNIFSDYIEVEEIFTNKVDITFADGINLKLTMHDYYVNLVVWRSILSVGEQIQSKHIFFAENITRGVIKAYFDRHIVIPYKDKLPNLVLNNILADTLDEVKNIDNFSYYIANTINMEDDIHLMMTNPEARDIYLTDMTNVPFEDIKRVGAERAARLASIIKDSDHCLEAYFNAKEGIDQRQYREYAINIGTKPDGNGGIYPTVINSSFIRGGLNTPEALFIESSGGRTAQILSKINVGDSGHFARLIGLNNSDTVLHKDPDYVCSSVNFQQLYIKDMIDLENVRHRYYRQSPNGMEYMIGDTDTHLIGTTIFLRSPMTCESHANGDGICYRCYGKLAYTNADINIGKYAAEEMSAQFTQRLLSAKHVLEAKLEVLEWSPGFDEYFVLDTNIVYLKPDIVTTGMSIKINPEEIELESEHDDVEWNEFISSFTLVDALGNEIAISGGNGNNDLYITNELNDIIRNKSVADDGMIEIQLRHLEDAPIFMMKINNTELSKALDMIKSIINKKVVTNSFDRHQFLQAFVDGLREGTIGLGTVHAEVILSNQICHHEDVLGKPDWSVYEPEYMIQTLDRALKENPSITVSLSYQKISAMLYNPLTFKKDGISFMDLYFMASPMRYLDADDNISYQGDKVIKKLD